MGRKRNGLTVKFVESNKHKPGMKCDGGGLYLRVAAGGSKQWIFRYRAKDPTHRRGYRLRDMSLGPVEDIPLAQAREEAQNFRRIQRDGTDPITWKMMARARNEAARAKTRTFQQCAEGYLQDNPSNMGIQALNDTKADLRRYVYPKLGVIPVHLIETPHILNDVLKPIWHRIPNTAADIRSKIKNILAWAKTHHFREGDNPAAWDLLKYALPAPKDISPVKPRAALPYQQIPQYMAALRQNTNISARCVELEILTLARREAVAGAKWDEFDLEARVWTIPGERMKGKKKDKAKSFRVPLSTDAIALLKQMESIKRSEYVFPGTTSGPWTSAHLNGSAALHMTKQIASSLSPEGMAERAALKQLGRGKLLGDRPLTRKEITARYRAKEKFGGNITQHGFRSTFTDWVAEKTSFERDVREMALAHTIRNATEAAYRRGDLFEKRIPLMQAWADYCSGRNIDEKVIPLRKHSS